jgi:NADPH:quinone reductase-like Zn-dependent oxidoreductase
MKAVFIKEHGGQNKLIYGERPLPPVGPDEVLVRVKACALNHLDIWVRQGPIPGITFPHILGSDAAGLVEKPGRDVTHFAKGQRVLAMPGVSCGQCAQCLVGQENLCAGYDILGQKRNGAYAEFVAVPAANLFSIPDGVSFEAAAAFPLVSVTAWHGLVTLGQIHSGQTVLIQAGGSGLGTAAIQIAKLWGATVITTVGNAAKAAKAKRLGADHVINYNERDFVKDVMDITQKRGAALAFDHVGQATFEKSLACVAKGGKLLFCGVTTGRDVKLDLKPVYSSNISIIGFRMGTRRDLREALAAWQDGNLAPVIDKTFPLKQASQAQAYMEERKNFGKIVLTV